MKLDLQQRYDSLIATKADALRNVNMSKRRIRELNSEIRNHEKARIVITNVAKITQKETKTRIENLVTLAIQSVFEEYNFSFELQFERKNNRVYAIPLVIEDGEPFDPKDDMGGGILDIISVSVKIILWHMEDPRKRNFLAIDEPFRFTGKLATKAGYMLKFISEKLKLQILMVSHDDELIDFCDRVYKVVRRNKVSKVKLIKGETIIRRRHADTRSSRKRSGDSHGRKIKRRGTL